MTKRSPPPAKSPSLESSSSVRLEPSRVPQPLPDISELTISGAHNCVVILVHCKKHDKFAFMKRNVSMAKQAMFMVTRPLGPADGVLKSLLNELESSLSVDRGSTRQLKKDRALEAHVRYKDPHHQHTLSIQIPGSEHFIRRYIYRVELDKNEDYPFCCQQAHRLIWYNPNEIKGK